MIRTLIRCRFRDMTADELLAEIEAALPQPEPQPHRFGHFIIPDDARLTMGSATAPFPRDTSYENGWYRDRALPRLEARRRDDR